MPYPSPLVVAVEESDATLHVRLAGEFDLAGVPLVEKALNRLSRAPVLTRVVFDLRAVSFLDLAGLRTVLRADARGRVDAFEVVVVRPRGTASRIFTLTRMGEQLTVVNEAGGSVTITTDLKADQQRRLINQRRFRHYFVKCPCERGCPVCAYTGLVSKAHARHA